MQISVKYPETQMSVLACPLSDTEFDERTLRVAVDGEYDAPILGIAALREQCPDGENACSRDNGGCDTFCLAREDGTRVCAEGNDVSEIERSRMMPKTLDKMRPFGHIPVGIREMRLSFKAEEEEEEEGEEAGKGEEEEEEEEEEKEGEESDDATADDADSDDAEADDADAEGFKDSATCVSAFGVLTTFFMSLFVSFVNH